MMRALTLLSVILIGLLGGCTLGNTDESASSITVGNSANGRRLLYSYGCGSCHTIPGVGEADGTVGPPLSGFGSRFYIAGVLQNTPGNLVRWIAHPRKCNPGTRCRIWE